MNKLLLRGICLDWLTPIIVKARHAPCLLMSCIVFLEAARLQKNKKKILALARSLQLRIKTIQGKGAGLIKLAVAFSEVFLEIEGCILERK